MPTEASLKRRWKALLVDAVGLARERGCKDPEVYIEGEAGLYVFDGDPHRGDHGLARLDNAVVYIGWPNDLGFTYDVGAF